MPNTYKAAFRKFRQTINREGRAIAAEVAGDLATSLIIKTPVDTTRAEANWIAALNTVPQEFDEAKRNPNGVRVNLDAAKRLAKQMKLGDVFVMANSTPYIFFLENGSSRQAPAGFRDLTAASFQRIVERALARRKGRP